MFFFFFFFFQAEDGIRDYKVTGVQTCALPICSLHTKSITGTGLPIGSAYQRRPEITAADRSAAEVDPSELIMRFEHLHRHRAVVRRPARVRLEAVGVERVIVPVIGAPAAATAVVELIRIRDQLPRVGAPLERLAVLEQRQCWQIGARRDRAEVDESSPTRTRAVQSGDVPEILQLRGDGRLAL